jgi:acetolactate decarboxylase
MNLPRKTFRSFLSSIFYLLSSALIHAQSEVQVIGEMRRMFTAHDIAANVDLAKLNQTPHLFALGPLAGLRGEVTVLDGQVFISSVNGKQAKVSVDPGARSVFLVYASVPAWRSVPIPTNVITEEDLAGFIESQLPKDTRSAFRVRGTAAAARYHIQNYHGEAKDLTHEAHDAAKAFFDLKDTPVDLVGFFTNREGEGGTFVHMGQTTHIHLISQDRKHMGHLESIRLAPGADLLLPAR